MKEKSWNEQRTRIFLGWEKGSQMTSHYANMTEDDVNDLILQDAGIKTQSEIEETEIRDKECPRCYNKNPCDAKYCNICSLVLDSKIADRHNKIIKMSDQIMDISQEKNLEIEKAVEKYIERIKSKIIKDLEAGTGNCSEPEFRLMV